MMNLLRRFYLYQHFLSKRLLIIMIIIIFLALILVNNRNSLSNFLIISLISIYPIYPNVVVSVTSTPNEIWVNYMFVCSVGYNFAQLVKNQSMLQRVRTVIRSYSPMLITFILGKLSLLPAKLEKLI